MSSSPVISTDKARPQERRSCARGVLNHYVVLVYFGEDNWGKLTNMSEGGMAFEFSRPPALRERVNFTFQVMGRMTPAFSANHSKRPAKWCGCGSLRESPECNLSTWPK